MSEIPDNAPSPRLCIIVKWPDFEGYGFNLHAEKSKPGQFIGKVDADSPAEMAGLKEGDRIIEVNGVNIANENHKQVVQRIKAVPNETKLLVVDVETDKYYKNKNIVVKSTQANVVTKTSVREAPQQPSPKAEPTPYTNGHHHHHDEDNRSVSSAASSSAASEGSTLPQPAVAKEEVPSESTADTHPENADEGKENENFEEREESSSPEEEVDAPKELPPPPPVPEDISYDGDEDSVKEEAKTSLDDEDAASSHSSVSSPGDVQESKVEETTKELERASLAESPEPKSDSIAEQEAPVAENANKPEATMASNSRRSSSASSSAASEPSDTTHTENTSQSPMSTSPTPPPSLDNTINKSTPSPTPTPAPVSKTTTTASTKNSPPPAAQNHNYNTGGLNLNMSAAEMRAVLARKKKVDPRKDSLDLRKKYEIIQNM